MVSLSYCDDLHQASLVCVYTTTMAPVQATDFEWELFANQNQFVLIYGLVEFPPIQ